MPSGGQIALRPVFIEAASGRLFGVYHGPIGVSRPSAVVYIPPFAEEMNRSRRMATLQARAFAAEGIATLLLDLFGTGDSAGDFGDARPDLWLDDISAAAQWLEAQGTAPPSLWGLRFGALLAAEVVGHYPQRFKRLLLWQPVVDGKSMLTQFLRIRVAAAMSEGGSAEKTEDLRARLGQGDALEVAGYALSADLARAIDGMRIDRVGPMAGTVIDWIEVGPEAGDRLAPQSARVVDIWREQGLEVRPARVPGDPFWTLQETTLAPALLAATSKAFRHGN